MSAAAEPSPAIQSPTAPAPRPKRRFWPRFSLASLLLMMFVGCCVAAVAKKWEPWLFEATLVATPGWVNEILLSPDGLHFYISDGEGTRIYDVRTRALSGSFPGRAGPQSGTWHLAPDGRRIAVVDDALTVYDAHDGSVIAGITSRDGWRPRFIGFLPNGDILYFPSDYVHKPTDVLLWEASKRDSRILLEWVKGEPILDPDGKTLTLVGSDEVHVFDLPSGQERSFFRIPHFTPAEVIPSPDGKHALMWRVKRVRGRRETYVPWIFDRATWEPVAQLPFELETLNPFETYGTCAKSTPFSPDGKHLAFLHKQMGVWVYDVETGKRRSAFPIPKELEWAQDITFNSDGRIYATNGSRSAAIINVNGTMLASFGRPYVKEPELAFNPFTAPTRSRYPAMLSADGTVAVLMKPEEGVEVWRRRRAEGFLGIVVYPETWLGLFFLAILVWQLVHGTRAAVAAVKPITAKRIRTKRKAVATPPTG